MGESMIQCRRCQNVGVKKSGKYWVSMSNNERWFVCEQCAKDIEWANRRMRQFNEELIFIIQERGTGQKKWKDEQNDHKRVSDMPETE